MPGLVDADEEDVGAPAERLGGAVAVVDVPVEDEDPLGAELADRQLGRDRDVVEEAEAHRPRRFGVVAGGAHGAEADPVLAAEQRPGHRAGAAGGVQGRAVGGLADEGVGVDRAAAGEAELADRLDVTGAVDELQLASLGGGASRRSQPSQSRSPRARSIATSRSGVSGWSGMCARGSCSRLAGWLK